MADIGTVAPPSPDAKNRRSITPKSKADLYQLIEAVRSDRKILQPFREQRQDAIRLGAGNRWGDNVLPQKQYLNLIGLYQRTVSRALIAKAPHLLLSTFNNQFRGLVDTMQGWANPELEKTGASITFRRIVTDALYAMGIAMVHVSTPADAAASGWKMQAGRPTISRIDFDDFSFDTHAREFGAVSYAAHRWRPPLYAIRDSNIYSKHRKYLTATYDRPYNQEGDEKASTLQREQLIGKTIEFIDRVDLWQFWLPDEQLILTLQSNDAGQPELCEGGEPLRVQKYIGAPGGPYRYLGFGIVPDNAMFKAPIEDQLDLHEAVNEMLRKLVDQGSRQKQNVFATGIADSDGNRLIKAGDGQVIRVDNADSLKQVSWGGPDQGVFALMNALKQLWDWGAGNISALGGLEPQSKTATQDKMLMASSSAGVSDMQDETTQFVSDVCKDWLWLCHYHPELHMESKPDIPGVPDHLLPMRSISPQQRRMIPFEQIGLRVDPYSLQHQTPAQRLQFIQGVLGALQPFMPLIQQAGHGLDIDFLLHKFAEYGDSPDLARLFQLEPPPAAPGGGGGGADMGGMPQNTTRTYERVNRGATTPGAKAATQQQIAFGGNPQAAERAKMSEPSMT